MVGISALVGLAHVDTGFNILLFIEYLQIAERSLQATFDRSRIGPAPL
jgi:hypothetical protein